MTDEYEILQFLSDGRNATFDEIACAPEITDKNDLRTVLTYLHDTGLVEWLGKTDPETKQLIEWYSITATGLVHVSRHKNEAAKKRKLWWRDNWVGFVGMILTLLTLIATIIFGLLK